MDPLARRTLGRTNVQVTCLGFGGATLGDIRERIDESRSETTIEVAYGAGIGYFDTAPWYGTGKSERRFGTVLGTKPRDSYVLSTKIGRVLERPADRAAFRQERWTHGLPFVVRFDYTYDGVMRSYEDSLTRMGVNRIDALLIHDLDHGYHGTDEGVQARIDELSQELQSAGLDLPIHYYVSTEWFTPDGTVSMAVPFYLTHPRLEKLEKAQMLEVEGGDYDWCMRILRHEAGHVIDNAFKLRQRKKRREIFA